MELKIVFDYWLQYWEALKICMDQTVEINEDLAEKLTPSKDDAGIDTMERVKILEAIAEVCMHQGEYHLATKKFTQAGNKIKVGTLGWYIWVVSLEVGTLGWCIWEKRKSTKY